MTTTTTTIPVTDLRKGDTIVLPGGSHEILDARIVKDEVQILTDLYNQLSPTMQARYDATEGKAHPGTMPVWTLARRDATYTATIHAR